MHPCLSELTLGRGQLRLALGDSLLEGARLLVLYPRLLFTVLQCAHELRLARLGFLGSRGHTRLRTGDGLLTFGDLRELLLQLGGRGRSLVVADFELVHLLLDEVLALCDPGLQLRQLFLLFEQAVQLSQPLADAALAVVELGLRLGQCLGAAVERGRLLCELLLDLRVSGRRVHVVAQ